MFARTVERYKLVKRDYNKDARHFIHANGTETPMDTYVSEPIALPRAFDQSLKDQVKNEIQLKALRQAQSNGLYGDDEFYAVDSWEPMFFFRTVNGQLHIEGRVDVIIPFRQILEF
jgi:hypothetical protein